MAVTEGRGIEREQVVQGAAGDSVHLGYFSDPETASVLVEAVLETASRSRPNLIADFGGGTGFIHQIACFDNARAERFGDLDGVYQAGPGGFTARLHYRIFLARAD